MPNVVCPKCGTNNVFRDHQFQKECDYCKENIFTTNTFCFFCGKVTTGFEKECDDPICIETYRLVKEEKRHPFFVTRHEAKNSLERIGAVVI